MAFSVSILVSFLIQFLFLAHNFTYTQAGGRNTGFVGGSYSGFGDSAGGGYASYGSYGGFGSYGGGGFGGFGGGAGRLGSVHSILAGGYGAHGGGGGGGYFGR